MSQRTPIVPRAVRQAFGVGGQVVALKGGEGVSVRIGDVVLKRVHDVDEAEWTQNLQSRMVEHGLRIPQPVPAGTGRWTHTGWSATEFIPGLRPVAPAWSTVVAIGLRFSDGADRAVVGGIEALDRRRHRWAVADRFAWDETRVRLGPEATDICLQLRALLLRAPHPDRQVIHGDLTGNIFLDRSDVPVVLDFSPYLRPRLWTAAIGIADAVLWHGAELLLAESFATTAWARDLLARAVIFRMTADQLATEGRHRAPLQPYRRVAAAIDAG